MHWSRVSKAALVLKRTACHSLSKLIFLEQKHWPNDNFLQTLGWFMQTPSPFGYNMFVFQTLVWLESLVKNTYPIGMAENHQIEVGQGQHQHVPKEVFLEFVQDLGQSPRTLTKNRKSHFWMRRKNQRWQQREKSNLIRRNACLFLSDWPEKISFHWLDCE